MNILTKAEEQVMHHMWTLKKAFLKDIVEAFQEPKPAYTTISTVVGVLVKKGFLKYDRFGKIRQYKPTIKKDEYFNKQLSGMISNFFSGSSSQFASFFANNGDLNVTELEKMKREIESKIETLKANDD